MDDLNRMSIQNVRLTGMVSHVFMRAVMQLLDDAIRGLDG